MIFSPQRITKLLLLPLITITFLAGCGGSSSDEDDQTQGYVRFYNASANAPELYFYMEEDLSEEIDDETQYGFIRIEYGEATSRTLVNAINYEMEIAYQDEDSSSREDLEVFHTQNLQVSQDNVTFLAVTGDISDPEILSYNIPVIDDDADDDNDQFNLQVLNLSTSVGTIDIWLSEEDETFEQASLIATVAETVLSDNIKVDQEDYIVYVTATGSTEVLFESTEISYNTTSQYIIAVRDNETISTSPLTIDNMSNGLLTNYSPQNSAAKVRFYNGVNTTDLLTEYNGTIKIESDITNLDNDAEVTIDELALGSFSNSVEVNTGDYAITASDAENGFVLINNQRLSLPQNTDRTVFLYSREEYVDADGDGNFDENDDGEIDEIKVITNLISVTNSARDRFFDNVITVINLIDNNDFSRVSVYFVKSDEVIDTAQNSLSAELANPASINLLNNTYELFVIATIDGVEQILGREMITLDDDTPDQFLLIEERAGPVSDYDIKLVPQIIQQ